MVERIDRPTYMSRLIEYRDRKSEKLLREYADVENLPCLKFSRIIY